MLLPITLVLFMVVVDGARVLLVSGAVADASYRSARAGAVVGGARFGDISATAFDRAIDEIPGGNLAVNPTLTVVRGGRCTDADRYVEVEADYTIGLLTPGLAAAFALVGGSATGGALELTSTAVARCEIAR